MKTENEINTNMNDIVKLFSYENRLDLEYCDSILRSCVVTNNSPFNRNQIKLHKGVDNLIRFRILNPDRKRVSVDHLAIRARLINSENQERVLERFADITPSVKGDATLTIFEGDLVNLAPAFYTLVVTGQETLVPGESTSDNVNTPFFADNAGNIVLTVEVVDGADVTPMESVTVLPENWTITNEVGSPTTFTSSAIAGARVQNHLNAVHSFSAATTAFTGTLELRGSLDLQPPSDITNYFPIDITSGTQIIDFDNFTGITAHTFEANFMWIKFIYRPDTSLEDFGTVDKVLLR
jgi:hypothetical protein